MLGVSREMYKESDLITIAVKLQSGWFVCLQNWQPLNMNFFCSYAIRRIRAQICTIILRCQARMSIWRWGSSVRCTTWLAMYRRAWCYQASRRLKIDKQQWYGSSHAWSMGPDYTYLGDINFLALWFASCLRWRTIASIGREKDESLHSNSALL